MRSRYVGRSCVGLTTNIHALADDGGLPIRLKLTEGLRGRKPSRFTALARLKQRERVDQEAVTR